MTLLNASDTRTGPDSCTPTHSLNTDRIGRGETKDVYQSSDHAILVPRRGDTLYEQTCEVVTWAYNAETLQEHGIEVIGIPDIVFQEYGGTVVPTAVLPHLRETSLLTGDALDEHYTSLSTVERQQMEAVLRDTTAAARTLFEQGEIAYFSPAELDGELYAQDIMDVPAGITPPVPMDDYSDSHVSERGNLGYDPERGMFVVVDLGELTEQQFARPSSVHESMDDFMAAHGIDARVDAVLRDAGYAPFA